MSNHLTITTKKLPRLGEEHLATRYRRCQRLLAIEALFALRNENFADLPRVQKTNDLTYALLAIIDVLVRRDSEFIGFDQQVKMTEVKKVPLPRQRRASRQSCQRTKS
jgi:hypothetical protein